MLRYFYNDIRDDVPTMYDTSAYPPDHPAGLPRVNKKIIGLMKDEAGGRQVEEFVGLRSKLYAFKIDDGSKTKKCKGVKKCVVKKKLEIEDYKDCVFNRNVHYPSMNNFQSRKHDIYTETVNKIAFSANDDKRIICEDGIHTPAIGHCRLKKKSINF